MSTPSNVTTITTSYKDAAGTVTLKTETVNGDYSIDFERLGIEVGTTNMQVTTPMTLTKILALGIGIAKTAGETADKTAKADILVNSTSVPDKTLHVTNSNGVGWSTGDAPGVTITSVLGANDVSNFYVTNTGTGKIDLFIRALMDATPGVVG